MSNRFGRKQKRKARAEIESLTINAVSLARRLQHAEWCAARAKDEAFKMFVAESDIYRMAVDRCSYELGNALGVELNKYADELLAIVVKDCAPLDFAYEENVAMENRTMKIVHIHIPLKELHYKQIVR